MTLHNKTVDGEKKEQAWGLIWIRMQRGGQLSPMATKARHGRSQKN
jgi:hypothetical protein